MLTTLFILIMLVRIILFLILPFSIQNFDLDKLASLGIDSNFYVSDIVIHFNKAYLAIPRTACANNISHPTLVDLPWVELNVVIKSRFHKPIEGQTWANCNDLQNAISLAKEGIKSKLWILDRGNEFCSPKIVVYNMLQNTFLPEDTIELAEVPHQNLNTIVIENDAKLLGVHRAFIGGAENSLLICYLKDLECVHTMLEHHSMVPTTFLSISKMHSTVYMTGSKSVDLFSLDVQEIPQERNDSFKLTVKYHGEKLGPSSGLETDLQNGLIYFLTRDYAIVRWMTEEDMKAEHYDVLMQSYEKMPYVSRIFTDPQDTVHVLVNPFPYDKCSENEKFQNLERTIKIMKYNRVLNKFT